MKFRSSYSILLLLFCSCAAAPYTEIKNFDNYQKQFLPKPNFAISKENTEEKNPKIVVLALDENGNEDAIKTDLGNFTANNVENALISNHLGEIIDRKAASKLQKEIALAELHKTGSYKGPIVADYAIVGNISQASSRFNQKNKLVITTVEGDLRIYALPSLSIVESIKFSATKGISKQDITQKHGELRIVSESAISAIISDLKNFFIKQGHVLEKRTFKDRSIFKISLGLKEGLKPGDKFQVIDQYESENDFTNQIEYESKIICTGTISDLIDQETSWAIIDDAAKSDAIHLGDAVKMQYKKNIYSSTSEEPYFVKPHYNRLNKGYRPHIFINRRPFSSRGYRHLR